VILSSLAFNVPTRFEYTGGCNGQGQTCSDANCNTAFHVPTDNQVQVACQTNDVSFKQQLGILTVVKRILLPGQPQHHLLPLIISIIGPFLKLHCLYTSGSTYAPNKANIHRNDLLDFLYLANLKGNNWVYWSYNHHFDE